MMKLNASLLSKENIILVAVAYLIIRSFFSVEVDDTEAQKLLRDAVTSKTNEITQLKQLRNEDKLIIQKFKDEYIQNDSIVDNYSVNELDSFMSNFLRQ